MPDTGHFDCRDCGMDTRDGVGGEIYLVHDELWQQYGPEGGIGCLCVGCLEDRMGRRLTVSDFKDARTPGGGWEINFNNEYHSARLRDRTQSGAGNEVTSTNRVLAAFFTRDLADIFLEADADEDDRRQIALRGIRNDDLFGEPQEFCIALSPGQATKLAHRLLTLAYEAEIGE